MAFPRVSAVIFLILLIGSLSLLCMGVFALYQTTEIHQNNEEYVEGKIVAIGSKMDFELVTEAGQHLHFSCSNSCRAFMTHMQRHFYEHAMTYVFYVEGSKNHLIAVNVD